MKYLLILTKNSTDHDTLIEMLFELVRSEYDLMPNFIFDERRALHMAKTHFYDLIIIHEEYTNVTNFVALTLARNPDQKFIVVGKDATTNDSIHYKNLGCVGYLKDDYLSLLNLKSQLKKIVLKNSPKFINMTYA